MKNKPYLSNTPPIREMTTYMFDSWKHIAKQEDKIMYLKNGLDIHPSGNMRIDYDCSAKYEANYQYDKLMVRIYEAQNTMEFILSNQLKDLACYPSMKAIMELPKERQDKILAAFTKIVVRKLAERNNQDNLSSD
ncbi:MAG: hypothetical protein Q7U70_00845 [Methylotenera sp.]|nr:hypothetical protein [Methylotenera sp.]MDO9389315.1 hypothetical protein [Methylotenera sp.]